MSRPNPTIPKQSMADIVNDLPVKQERKTFTLAIRPDEKPILDEMQNIVKDLDRDKLAEAGQFGGMLVLGRGMNRLRELVREMPEFQNQLMELQGSALGFRTDKDKDGGYQWPVVAECFLEAAIRGARPTGNEFNIISERAYLTKEYFARRVQEFPGLSDLKLSPGVPTVKPNATGAIVPYRAEWRLNGEAFNLEREIPIRVNSGMGADAILGKATRKILAAVYGRLTGSELTVPDGEIDDGPQGPPPTGSAQDVAARVQAARDAAAANATQAPATPPATSTAAKPPSQPLPTINAPPEDDK